MRRAVGHHVAAVSILVISLAVMASSVARADGTKTCEGPTECCALKVSHGPKRQVSIGVVVMGVSNINEKTATWDADFYLYEEWTPGPDFTPQTEIVNEMERHSTQFDEVDLRDGRCLRSRRMRSTVRAEYNLRRFPFDEQKLTLELSDNEFTSKELEYDAKPYAIAFDDHVRELANWKIHSEPNFERGPRTFRWERGAPTYDYGTFSFEVRRHVTFHLFKYFLPLLVIVALAFSVFWIDADDLGAPATIGITCLLAAIAFQFAEASSLPEVSYLTLADRVYVVCYVAIGSSLIQSIYTNNLGRRDHRERAIKLEHRCRIVFPIATVIALAVSVVRAFTEAS
jgi:hypothetical protein